MEVAEFRLLHLISEKPPVKSGFARAISRLAEELTKLGHEVDVLSASDCQLKVIGEIKLIVGMRKIDEHLREEYDIVNIHGNTPMFSDRLLLKSKAMRKKIVNTYHCPAAHYVGPASYMYNSIFNSLMPRLVDAVITTSISYYDALSTSKRKYLVSWGVDSDMFAGARIPHEGYRVLYVGQMRPYKGLKVLIQAMKGTSGELNIVGNGPDRTKLQKYSKRSGLQDVHFHGAIPDDELREMYLCNDVVVLPSISTNEAFGLITLEAASAGCAVVASDLPGLRDVVKDFGILVKPKDTERLRNVLLDLRNDSARAKYVSNGLKVATRYSWKKTALEYERVYRDVLAAQQPSV